MWRSSVESGETFAASLFMNHKHNNVSTLPPLHQLKTARSPLSRPCRPSRCCFYCGG